MSQDEKTIIRYSLGFKRQVIKEIEEDGLGIEEVRRRYGIKGGSTIQQWLRKFGKSQFLNTIIRVEMKSEVDRIKELEAELKRVKLALADSTMKNALLENLVKIAGENYKADLKKTFGQSALDKQTNRKDML